MSTSKSQIALKTCAATTIAFGLLIAVGAHPQTNWIPEFLLDAIFWPIDGSPTLDHPAARLLAAIGGGVLVGWGVTLWGLAGSTGSTDPAFAALLARNGAMAWFITDSIGSVLAGAPVNAVLNVAFLVLFLLPAALLPSPRRIPD